MALEGLTDPFDESLVRDRRVGLRWRLRLVGPGACLGARRLGGTAGGGDEVGACVAGLAVLGGDERGARTPARRTRLDQHLLGLRRGRFQNGNRCLRERVRLERAAAWSLRTAASRRTAGKASAGAAAEGPAAGAAGGRSISVSRALCTALSVACVRFSASAWRARSSANPCFTASGSAGEAACASRIAARGPFRDDGRFAAEGLHMRQGLGQRLLDLLRGGSGELPRAPPVAAPTRRGWPRRSAPVPAFRRVRGP